MSVDSKGPSGDGVPELGRESRDEPRAGAAEPGGPTLAALLHTLTRESPIEPAIRDPLSAALRTVRSHSTAEPLGLEVAGVLLSGMLRAIRRELGGHVGDMALRSMSHKPLTRRSVERVLRAAVELSAAREEVLASTTLLDGRHEALLRQCVELTGGGDQSHADPRAIGESAARLHDRVRIFLEKQGRWPIQDSAEYERYAKPAAIVMAAWDVPIRLDDP